MIKIYRDPAEALRRDEAVEARNDGIRDAVSAIIADVRERGDAALIGL